VYLRRPFWKERMDFRGAILSFDQPPLTKTAIILDKELVGQPITLQESNYTPAIPASPSHISHPYPSMWILTQLGAYKNDYFLEDIKLERGSQFVYLTSICHFGEKHTYHCLL